MVDILILSKKEKTTINPKYDDDICFQYAATITHDCKEIRKTSKNIKNFSIRKGWLGKILKLNLIIALNELYQKEKEIYSVYISRYNSTCEKNCAFNNS